MKNSYLILCFSLVLAACSGDRKIISVVNETGFDRSEVIQLNIESFQLKAADLSIKAASGEPINFDVISEKGGFVQDLLVLVNSSAQSKADLVFSSGKGDVLHVKMTQAEISTKEGGTWNGQKYEGGKFVNRKKVTVPASHTDHSYWIRYEGPGWESDKVGYRFYLDWRNGVDIFGKKTTKMSLQDVGLDGFDSYHEMADWGLDILKVGSSLGMGSIGRFLNDSLYRFQEVGTLSCEITRDGDLKSEITTEYNDWVTETDTLSLTSVLSIEAGSRVTKHELSLNKGLEGFCTGLVKSKGETYWQMEEGNYQLIATYGAFSLANDNLGMAVIIDKSLVNEIVETDHSHVVVFEPKKELSYHFLAAWEQEADGIHSKEAFKAYLTEELSRLNHPLIIQ